MLQRKLRSKVKRLTISGSQSQERKQFSIDLIDTGSDLVKRSAADGIVREYEAWLSPWNCPVFRVRRERWELS